MTTVGADRARALVESATIRRVDGIVENVVGLIIEARGPSARIGDLCFVETETASVAAEVVGFRGPKTLLMPLGELTGIRAGCYVRGTGRCFEVPVGPQLLGRTLDALGNPMDSLGSVRGAERYPVWQVPPNALERPVIREIFETGVRSIDGLLTMGEGQRVGIFAGSGVGKSTLMGMIARRGGADVNVIALVGERGREVREFIENDLGTEGLARSVVICATSDQPALMRIKAALTATAVAEYFRDQGLRVMMMMDSVTRFCMAQREVGLAVGEPPSTKGYTPSVFAMLPKLMERTGTSAKGSITALYTVLVDGDDTNEPIADAARSILDGHFVLSRKLVSRGHYPPIDPLASLSRLMAAVASDAHREAAERVRQLIAAYLDAEDLITIGAYQPGGNALLDEAVNKWPAITAFLRQAKHEGQDFELTVRQLTEIVA